MALRRSDGFRKRALANCAFGGRSAGFGSLAVRAGMFLESLRMVFSGYQQEPSAALVRHDALREPREGPVILCAAETRALTTEGTGEHRGKLPFPKVLSALNKIKSPTLSQRTRQGWGTRPRLQSRQSLISSEGP